MTQTRCTLISHVRMAEYDSSPYSFKTDDDYDLSLSPSLSSEASEEIDLSSPRLEMDVQPYRFEPVLPPTADRDIDSVVHNTVVSESSLVDHVGNTDW